MQARSDVVVTSVEQHGTQGGGKERTGAGAYNWLTWEGAGPGKGSMQSR